MNAYEKIKQLNEKEFKLITGVRQADFEKILELLHKEHANEHVKGGQPGMQVELRLTLALEYWREYRTFRHMANDHQISKTVINRAVLWVEDVLSESEEFKIKDLKERFKSEEDFVISVIAVDVEEQPIERPTTKQEESYSGKKNAIQQSTKS
jgi:hypothetical protein